MPIPSCDLKRTIRIAGAGPAGLAAGTLLAKRGFDVEIHEACSDVATRWRRGLQIIENFSEKGDVLDLFRSAGIDINFYNRPVHELALWDRKNRCARFESREPLGYYVKRGSFDGALDRGLLDQARSAGVRVHFNSAKSLRDGLDIISTGPRRVDGMGKEVTFRTKLSDRMTVILDPVLAPGGYAYLFIVEGQATLGMAVLHGFKRVDEYFNETIQRFKTMEQVEIEGGEVSYSCANFFMRRSGGEGKEMYLGEAAGFQDYLFGFGIRFAVESAILAARSISEGLPFDDLCRARLCARQEMSLWNRFLYEKGRVWLPGIFIGLGRRSKSFRDYMRSWYRRNLLKSLTLGWIKRSWRNRNLFLDESTHGEPFGSD